jgi:hypothetical protein
MYSSFEGYGKEPFTLDEAAQPLNNIRTEVNSNENSFSSNYIDISNTLVKYNNMVSYLHANNNKYHYDDYISSMTLINHTTPKKYLRGCQ